MCCLYILEINPLSLSWVANIFSHCVGCLFILCMVSFAMLKLLSLIRSHLFIFVFISITLVNGPQKGLLQFMSKSVLPMFSSRSFIIPGWFFVCLFFLINWLIYFWLHWVFVAARRLFSSCGEQGLLFVAVRELLIAVASLVAEHGV